MDRKKNKIYILQKSFNSFKLEKKTTKKKQEIIKTERKINFFNKY